MTKTAKARLIYAISFIILVAVEVLIALFVRDRFVRPYLGDVIVVAVLYCMVRAVFPDRIKLLPLWLFIFAVLVEVGQYFNYVELLGLSDSRFFTVLMGSSFSWADILCYGCGAILCAVVEWRRARR